LCIIGGALVLAGCSSLSADNLFGHYSLQNQGVYSALRAGDYQGAEELAQDGNAGDILDNMQRGRLSMLNHDYAQSKHDFELSERAVRAQQDQAVVSLSELSADIGSLAVNDNLTSYEPADYELGFLHLYLALNYLHSNSLEGALVEVRKANQVQEAAKKKREQELQNAEQEVANEGVSANLGAILSQYPDAGRTLQAVQNGYLFYLSALLYETADELNSAYVDYRRALAVLPDNRQVIDGALRVARKLGMGDDLRQMEQRYGKVDGLANGQARIIVLDEQGVVEGRSGWTLSLPVYTYGRGTFYNLALPYYEPQPSDLYANLKLGERELDQYRLVNVNLMAQRDLTERLPAMVLRQVLRIVVKEQLSRNVAEDEAVGNLLFDVWNMLTEQPDTRSWQTLPAEVYSSSVLVPAGEHQISVGGNSYTFTVRAGQTALVWISRQGDGATVWHKQLGTL
jgi:hypothetical protein